MKIKQSAVLMWLMFSPGSIALAGGPQIVINEVFYQDTGSGDWVEYKNIGSTTVDISTWWTCTGLLCVQPQVVVQLAGDDLIMEPGEIVALDTAFFADEVAGEFVLENPQMDTFDFMQYGAGVDFGRSAIAAGLGLWLELEPDLFDFVPTSAVDESASWCGRNSAGGSLTTSEDFRNGPPTLGAENFCVFLDGFESGDLSAWSQASR